MGFSALHGIKLSIEGWGFPPLFSALVLQPCSVCLSTMSLILRADMGLVGLVHLLVMILFCDLCTFVGDHFWFAKINWKPSAVVQLRLLMTKQTN